MDMREGSAGRSARSLAARAASALAVGGVAVGVAVMTMAPAASAAGGGYTPGTPVPGGTATGLPGSVVTVTTIQPGGGKATAVVGASTISATVPAGTFSVPTQAVFTDAGGVSVTPSAGGTVIVTFGVGFYQNGTKVSGSFSPVKITVTNPSISSTTTVYFVVNGVLEPVSGATVSNGSATFTITSDPTVELTSALSATATAVPSATTVSTGEPFLLEGGVASVLVLGGALLLARSLRRRPA